YEFMGLTSRTCQCRGSCPGVRVIPRDPAVNGPYNSNFAGGSFQFATFVIYVQAKARLTFASTEWAISHAMSFTTHLPIMAPGSHCLLFRPTQLGLARMSGIL